MKYCLVHDGILLVADKNRNPHVNWLVFPFWVYSNFERHKPSDAMVVEKEKSIAKRLHYYNELYRTKHDLTLKLYPYVPCWAVFSSELCPS